MSPRPHSGLRPGRGPRSGRVLVGACVSLVTAVVAALVAEGVHRLSLEGGYDAADFRRATLLSIDNVAAYTPESAEVSHGRKLLRLLHPYTGSEQWHDTGGVLKAFRERPADDDAFLVLVVGGSVAMAWSNDPGDVFVDALRADPRLAGREVRVLRYAHAAYKQPQQLNRVAYLFNLGYAPDAVVNLDGFNEVASGLQSGKRRIHPVYPAAATWASVLDGRGQLDEAMSERMVTIQRLKLEAQARFDAADGRGWFRSSLLGHHARRRIERLNAERRAAQAELLALQAQARQEAEGDPDSDRAVRNREQRGPDFPRDDASIVAIAVRSWFEGSRSLHAICAARGIPYLHVLQPTLLDARSKPIAREEQAFVDAAPRLWGIGVELGYPELRRHGARLAEDGVPFLDLTAVFSATPAARYVDPVHLLPQGSKDLSRRIAPALLDLLD